MFKAATRLYPILKYFVWKSYCRWALKVCQMVQRRFSVNAFSANAFSVNAFSLNAVGACVVDFFF